MERSRVVRSVVVMNTTTPAPSTVPFDLGAGAARRSAGPAGTASAAPRTAAPWDAAPSPSDRPRPRLPWGARVALTMVAMIVAAFGALPLMLIPGFAAASASHDPMTAVLALLALCTLTCAVYLLLSWALMRGIDCRPFRDLGLAITPRAVLGLLAGMGIALVATLVGTGLVQFLGIGRMPAGEMNFGQAPLWMLVIALLAQAFLLQGIGEEVLFRGYLQRSLPHRPAMAVLISAAAFGIMHLVSKGGQENMLERVIYLAVPFGFALAAGFLALRMGTTWAAIGIHGGSHVASAIAAALGLVAEGPAQWLVVGVLFALAGVAVHLLPRRAASAA